MNCEEAQLLMEYVWDLPDNDLRRIRLRQHIQTCGSCAVEYEMWEDSLRAVHSLEYEVTEARAEAINRNVMDRIYRDFPMLVEENEKGKMVSRIFRKRLTILISGFLALFGSSFLYFALKDNTKEPQPPVQPTGILPTGVVDGGTVTAEAQHYNIPGINSGIIDPLVVSMDPSQPEYWMILSILGVGLALFFLMRLNRVVRR
ncbi:anti-sigma factor family protein [Paenibacillus dakarensis]|uniref:anti-sigma factor family protein n=1 Tax=Paenibacillus dakarensis TaxID=1527293 RepID=UPI0006D5350C|nr:zf-HC2 domain-containing protein [Paenibacillus dakarensis]